MKTYEKKFSAWNSARKIDIDIERCSKCNKRTSKLERHHFDYDQKDNVLFLCKSCHMKVHYGGSEKKDNSTFFHKIVLRKKLLKEIKDPVIMETNGGYGEVFKSIYSHVKTGIVLEKEEDRILELMKQRPEWWVYCCNSIDGLRARLGKNLKYNLIDIDPYGNPWEIIEEIFNLSNERQYKFQNKLCIAVNDGMMQKIKLKGAWTVNSMKWFVDAVGNDEIFKYYKDLCVERLSETVSRFGFVVKKSSSYYCGNMNGMTHYGVVCEKKSSIYF